MCSPCTPSDPSVDPNREMVSAERPRGVFSRQLFLGENLDAGRIEASYGGGVLRLTIPVAEKAKPRRIKIASEEKTSHQRLTTVHLSGWAGAQHPGKGVSDMATDTAWATTLLDEATAIVEAEWIRLQQDVALGARARRPAHPPSCAPAPPAPYRRHHPMCAGGQTNRCQRTNRRAGPRSRPPPTPIWATQRSPPPRPGACLKGTVGQGR